MLSQRVEGLTQRSAGGQNVVDDQHSRAGAKGRSATEFPAGLCVCRSFGIGGREPKLACDLECEDHAASRRSNDYVDFLIPEAIGDEPARLRGSSGLAEKVELFDVPVAMAT